MSELLISQSQFFLLIFVRLMGLIFVAPFFSSFLIPTRVKVMLALAITAVMFPILSAELSFEMPREIVPYILMVSSELLIGIALGLVVSIVLAVFQLAGQFFSIQIGFGISEVFDPLSQFQVPLMGQLLALTGVLIFLSMNGEQILIEAVYESFFRISVSNFLDLAQYNSILVQIFSDFFLLALRISFPIVGTLFIVTLALGLLAKFAPQMNVLMLGFPIYIVVGSLVLVLLVPGVVDFGSRILEFYLGSLFRIF